MKTEFYSTISLHISKSLKAAFFSVILLAAGFKLQAQELIFSNPSLVYGTGGSNNAVYRFSNVTTGVDALVKINGRSSNDVKLASIDITNTGFNKSFQPHVTFPGSNCGKEEWWMEFQISFVKANTSNLVTINSFKSTALDIDGDSYSIHEWVAMYGFTTYTTEANTQLDGSNIYENVGNVSTVVGRRFDGPLYDYANIDTTATRVMFTAAYDKMSSVKIRVGGVNLGSNRMASRLYSIYFKSFNYNGNTEIRLPVTLKSFTASLESLKPALNWVSSMEENLNYYSLERSTNGTDFNQVSITFAKGNSVGDVAYKYTDNAVPSDSKGVLYYRLKMVDVDGKYKYSETKLVRMGSDSKQVTVQLFPNPVVNDLRIGLPAEMQQKAGSIEILTLSGQIVKQVLISSASQTEQVSVSSLPSGAYLVRVNLKGAVASQRFIKQ